MEINQLEAFIAVAQERNFSVAAEKLDISQPSLSARIRRLEQGLGLRLIDRQSRPARLTARGNILLPYAERTLAILAEAEERLRAEDVDSAKQIKLGCPFSVATYLMPDVVERFSQNFPKAELFIETGYSDFVVAQLGDGLLSLGIAAAFPKYMNETRTLLRLHDEMAVAVSQRHPLAGLQDIRLAELWAYRILLIHWGAAFQAHIEYLRQMSATTGALVRLPLAGALPMIRQPGTVSFMPRRLVYASGLAEVGISDFSYAWDIVLLTRPGRSLTKLEQAFVNIVDEVWRETDPLP